MAMTSVDIASDGSLTNERTFNDPNTLWHFLNVPPPTSVPLRIFLVKELSGEALQMLSTALGIHCAFWAWVASEEASDGSWLNDHNGGKILSFDMPCMEMYATREVPRASVVREGRLKQLSSRHRLFGDRLKPGLTNTYDVYVNRRASLYLVPKGDHHTLLYFYEDCQSISSWPLERNKFTDPVSTEWVFNMLKEAAQSDRVHFAQEPVGLVLKILRRLLHTWHVFTYQIQRDMDKIDDCLPDRIDPDHPMSTELMDIGPFLHRDIVQTLFRFIPQLGKYEVWMNYVSKFTKDQFRPKIFLDDITRLLTIVNDMRRRLDMFKDRGNLNLSQINNYIALQQALNSAMISQIQQRDSQSGMRLSVVATVFLPLSFAVSWLSINSSTPLWVFFVVAMPSIFVTTLIILYLKWRERFRREMGLSNVVVYLFRRLIGLSTDGGFPNSEKFNSTDNV